MTRNQAMHKLERIFSDERRHLVRGEISALSRVSKRKEALMDALHAVELDQSSLQRLIELTSMSQDLINAAQNGIDSARERLSAIKRGLPTSTYSANGAKSEILKPVRTLQRRA